MVAGAGMDVVDGKLVKKIKGYRGRSYNRRQVIPSNYRFYITHLH